jgi:hypothetical protein
VPPHPHADYAQCCEFRNWTGFVTSRDRTKQSIQRPLTREKCNEELLCKQGESGFKRPAEMEVKETVFSCDVK